MGKLRYVFSCNSSGRPYNRGLLLSFRTDDNACVIFDEDRVIFASESERFTKRKHDFESPIWALNTYLKHNESLNLADLEFFSNDYVDHDHHLSHVYEAFYQSGFKDAAVLVNDGNGSEDDCITLAYIKEGCKPQVFKRFEEINSPCSAYRFASHAIFGHNHTEGKLMGLAAYGSDNGKEYIKWSESDISINVDFDQLELDLNDVKAGKFSEKKDVKFFKDIAFTLQKNFEEALVNVVRYFKSVLDEEGISTENFCMSGGGILNCPTNSKIIDLGLFKNFYASPQPSDGCAESIGRAFRNMEAKGEKIVSRRLETAYLGTTYSSNEIDNPVKVLKNPTKTLCEHISDGGVIAWYQGGAEYGPRALGHRSFLADPRSEDMLDGLNKIKGREKWRPLAPIIPERLFPLVFNDCNRDMCEFMLRTLEIKDEWKEKLKAVCHFDGSTRPQILKRSINPELYDLMVYYFDQTGIPCLINTSLNINGFPIVETPTDLCNLAEEIEFMDDIPKVMTVFVGDGEVREILPCPRDAYVYTPVDLCDNNRTDK